MSKQPTQLLSYTDAAAMLGMPLGTLMSMVSRQQIPHRRLGKRIVKFDLAELERWIDSKRVPAKE